MINLGQCIIIRLHSNLLILFVKIIIPNLGNPNIYIYIGIYIYVMYVIMSGQICVGNITPLKMIEDRCI